MFSSSSNAAPEDVCIAHAKASFEAVARGDYEAAGKHFAPTVAKQLPPAKIRQIWQSIQRNTGKYQSHGRSRVEVIGGQPVVVTPVEFEHAQWDALYGCNDDARITAAQLMPATRLAATIDAEARAAEAKKPVAAKTQANGIRIAPLSVPSPYGPLRGALTLPAGKGPFPAVVLVAGSGPHVMDETVGGSKPFRDLAEGLAAAGVASLRYDKRSADYPKQMRANRGLTVDEEATDDALAAVQRLAKQDAIDSDRLFVLGHSEGAMLAPRIGRRAPKLAGLILLAAPARKLVAIMRQQTREQGRRQGLSPARVQASNKARAEEQRLLENADPDHPPEGDFMGAPQTWWLSLHRYDQVAVAKSLSLPMLFLQGGRDFQVSAAKDFEAWETALADQSNVAFRLYPGLSHLFTPAGKTLTPTDYHKPAYVDSEVISDIAGWIKSR
ncbi:alpha/beta hydrolase [Salinisphaera sp. SPP-AMP-43]|uniref:alpha/beta hydrolase n=1 Tax=Salinisphaera sp. SPP-AMP-43 TaxID=3121288 RepID=UPI003C6E81BD